MEIFLNLCKVNLLCYQMLSKIIFQWGFFSRASLPLSSDGLYWGLSHPCRGNLLCFLWNGFPVWKWILCIQSALISTQGWFFSMARWVFHDQLEICGCISQSSLASSSCFCHWECSFCTFCKQFFMVAISLTSSSIKTWTFK